MNRTAFFVVMLTSVFVAGCSTMQPPPVGPSYAAHVPVKGKRAQARDIECRQLAAQAAQQVRTGNAGMEVGGAVIGTVAGAVLGKVLSTPGHTTWHGSPWSYYGYGHWHRTPGTNLTGVGAVGGAVAGAALGTSATRSPQAAYDAAYLECMR